MAEHACRVNINDNVKVKLTPEGESVYLKYMQKHHPGFDEFELEKRDEYGYRTFQLWCFMVIFAPKTYMGGKTLFHRNELIFFPE